MRINSLTLKNIRLVGNADKSISFSPTRNTTIFLGENGCGKTTILDSIALLISPFIAQFPGMSDKIPAESDVHIGANGRQAPFLEIKGEFHTTTDAIVSETRTRKGREKAPESDLKEIKLAAQQTKENIIANPYTSQLPVFVYYGTGRGNINAPERKRNFQKVFERWDCYKNALTPSTDFKSFFAWFDLMEDEERREKQRLRDFDYTLPALNAVRTALTNFVGEKFSAPRIELHPLRFVMSENTGTASTRSMRIEQMSDGYKIIIAMVADIASRMAEANPYMDNPLESSGIVMIDEIDLHLHPKWQRLVTSQLVKTFPNVQFILTTHSPIIVAGAADIAQVIHLQECTDGDESNNGIEINEAINTLDVGQILLSHLFGMSSLRAPIWDAKINRRNELLGKSELNREETSELKSLNEDLSVLTVGETPSQIKIAQLLEKLSHQLNCES